MICLQCGDCCIRFDVPEAGKTAGQRCLHLDAMNKCVIYADRPSICRQHDYPAVLCPIGLEKQKKTPTGKCLNCGGLIFDGGYFCSRNCEHSFAYSIQTVGQDKRNCNKQLDIYLQ